MRIYIAAMYQRRAQMAGHALELEALGHTVVSSWVWKDEAALNDSWRAFPQEQSIVSDIAIQAVYEIRTADLFLAFTEIGSKYAGTGGRHVELGVALMCDPRPRIMIVGPRENIFHAHDWMPQFEHWREALLAIGAGESVKATR